ncbi:NADPH-dependent FMN reductase ArsH [Azotobacter chroococcum NCIMB 8003]|uniref:NADPH-dependent FMN reductase ArsH n=1 Tax=Azotobacter chroococcum NCIMB 8003 TaxID=1328314 RepID=A0A0C4WMJ1_9GAMM|nr:NAD(P)H-dependent oxidoreductase [Azotobacter chroococcum]AJE21576.1 NADPH-dependent FMN reductase ArsH [Azotobacter chroococcum NCIMB 8003]
MPDDLPNLDPALLDLPSLDKLGLPAQPEHLPRILLLYGSNRERSYSRLLVQEAARLLERLGAEPRIFDPAGLPLPDDAPESHPKVQELRELVLWSEGQVWCSPERHGAMSAVFKAQIDWIPLTLGAIRPTQGKTLALFAWLLSLHPTAAGRVYAAYGGVYVGVALLWLWLVDGVRPTLWDLLGGSVALAGMAIIMLAPRTP